MNEHADIDTVRFNPEIILNRESLAIRNGYFRHGLGIVQVTDPDFIRIAAQDDPVELQRPIVQVSAPFSAYGNFTLILRTPEDAGDHGGSVREFFRVIRFKIVNPVNGRIFPNDSKQGNRRRVREGNVMRHVHHFQHIEILTPENGRVRLAG